MTNGLVSVVCISYKCLFYDPLLTLVCCNNTFIQISDFHGECDLVLVDIPNFAGDTGIKIHIRTTSRYEFSYIESAAIMIGEDVLEISSFGQYLLNGVSNAEMPNMLSGYVVTHTTPRENQNKFEIDLGNERHITAKVFKDMVSVNVGVNHGDDAEFLDAVGLLGHWGNGTRLARDGVTVMSDPNAYGQEWQVLDTEDQLFITARKPQFPTKCFLPDLNERTGLRASRRRLGEGISAEAAGVACLHVSKEVRDMCIFDVIATNDLTVAHSGVY